MGGYLSETALETNPLTKYTLSSVVFITGNKVKDYSEYQTYVSRRIVGAKPDEAQSLWILFKAGEWEACNLEEVYRCSLTPYLVTYQLETREQI